MNNTIELKKNIKDSLFTGLIAIGYTMVYGIIGMINFAHGDIFMIGAFIAIISFLIFGLTSVAIPLVLLFVLLISMLFTAC